MVQVESAWIGGFFIYTKDPASLNVPNVRKGGKHQS